MKEIISKPNEDLEFFNRRLDEVRLSGHERQKAKARFAQAEAIADTIVAAVNLVQRLLQFLVVRPYRRLMTSVG